VLFFSEAVQLVEIKMGRRATGLAGSSGKDCAVAVGAEEEHGQLDLIRLEVGPQHAFMGLAEGGEPAVLDNAFLQMRTAGKVMDLLGLSSESCPVRNGRRRGREWRIGLELGWRRRGWSGFGRMCEFQRGKAQGGEPGRVGAATRGCDWTFMARVCELKGTFKLHLVKRAGFCLRSWGARRSFGDIWRLAFPLL